MTTNTQGRADTTPVASPARPSATAAANMPRPSRTYSSAPCPSTVTEFQARFMASEHEDDDHGEAAE